MPLELLGETAMRDHPVIQAVQKVRHWISEAVGHVRKDGLRTIGTSGTSPRPPDEPATRRREAEGQGMTPAMTGLVRGGLGGVQRASAQPPRGASSRPGSTRY